MKWTAVFIPLMLLLTMEKVTCFCEFANFSSPISNYSKLIPDLSDEDRPIDYFTVMAQRC